MKRSSQRYDAIVVGGGPAGTSTAIHLRRNGARVLLAEAKKFPRPKLCGEFISPECMIHFEHLGVREAIMRRRGAQLAATMFYARSGRSLAVPSSWLGSSEALGLSRAEMDEALLKRAREIGVEVLEEAQAVDLVTEEQTARGVRLKIKNEVHTFHSTVTIDATGRSRALVRRAQTKNLTKTAPRKRAALVAFKVHLEDARIDDGCCEIYFYKNGYGGLSSVEQNRSNLCFIVAADEVGALEGKGERAMHEIVMSNRRAAQTLARARTCSPWLCVALDGFGRQELTPMNGLLTVGDAAAFIDPFTGSGILMALESGDLAAAILSRWLPELGTASSFASLASAYHAGYNEKFAARLRVCAWLRRAAFAPQPIIEGAVSLLSASSSMRQRLACATRQQFISSFQSEGQPFK